MVASTQVVWEGSVGEREGEGIRTHFDDTRARDLKAARLACDSSRPLVGLRTTAWAEKDYVVSGTQGRRVESGVTRGAGSTTSKSRSLEG